MLKIETEEEIFFVNTHGAIRDLIEENGWDEKITLEPDKAAIVQRTLARLYLGFGGKPEELLNVVEEM